MAHKKILMGTVVSDKMMKTIVVGVERQSLERVFKKYVRRMKKYKVHDEKNEARIGDRVEIFEGRPLSREKSWRLLKIIKKNEDTERTAA